MAFRRRTLPPLDDGLHALRPTIPRLTRSGLRRRFQRHDVSRSPGVAGDTPRKAFKACPIGCFHIDIAEARTEEGKLRMLVAIDRTRRFACAEPHARVGRRVAADFLRRPVAAAPCRIHAVPTDRAIEGAVGSGPMARGAHFTDPAGDGWTPADIRRRRAAKEPFPCHAFEAACAQAEIDHRLTKPNHPWSEEDRQTVQRTVCPTNGQGERMNRTLKEATVHRRHHETRDKRRAHPATFPDACTFARRLKTPKGRTAFERIREIRAREPRRFRHHPDHPSPGPNT